MLHDQLLLFKLEADYSCKYETSDQCICSYGTNRNNQLPSG